MPRSMPRGMVARVEVCVLLALQAPAATGLRAAVSRIQTEKIERPPVVAQHRVLPGLARDRGRSVPLRYLGAEAEGSCDGNRRQGRTGW